MMSVSNLVPLPLCAAVHEGDGRNRPTPKTTCQDHDPFQTGKASRAIG